MLANLKIGVRLILLVAVMAVLLVVIGIFGLHSAEKSNAALAATYQDRLEPTGMIGKVMFLMGDNRAQIMLGLQHNPENPLSKLHDHPITLHADTINKNRDEITALWKAYAARNLSAEEKALADKYAAARAKYVSEGLMPARDALLAGEYHKANEILLKLNSVYRDANQDADALLAFILKSAKTEYESSAASYQSARTASILTILFGLAFGIGFSLWIIRTITGPVEELKSAMRYIRESNDLTRVASVPHHDEIGQMAEAFNGLMDSFRSIIGRVTESTVEVTDAAVQLASASSQVAESTHQQSDAAASMAAAVEQMTVSVGQVAEHAREAQTISNQSGELSVQGGDVIHSATGEMRKIADSVNQSSEMVRLLGEESSRITDIVNVIKDIADQTNLLALNAAIEAARAGEQGRGFAVVADEVRKLAERTAKSTQEIAGMVDKIQMGTESAVGSMEAGVSQVSEGVALANQAGEAITHIREGSQRVVQAVNDISLAIKEQSIASEEIAANVEKIAQMSEENSAAAQQTAGTAHHLQELAASLKEAVSRFRV